MKSSDHLNLGVVLVAGFLQLFTSVDAADISNLQRVLKPYGAKAGLSVRDELGKEIVSIQSNTLFKPASVAKMISSACAFKELGSEHQFETRWGYRGNIKNGTLTGDLVVHAGGDFSFVIEDLKMIVEVLRFVYGIQNFQGKLIFDTSSFENPTWENFEGFEGDEGRSFHAVMSAAPINYNSFALWVAPTDDGARAHVIPNESLSLQVLNRVQVKSGKLNGQGLNLDYQVNQKTFAVGGSVGKDDEPKAIYRALPDPYESFARLFKYNFELAGGKWAGTFATSREAILTKTLYTHRSRSLSKLLMDINKLSTNFGAEMVLLEAARATGAGRTSPEKAKTFLSNCISQFGMKQTEMMLTNASGLSRESSLQPQALTKFLTSLRTLSFYPEYLSSLSVLGQDGTTRNRLKDLRGSARLKTGSIKGVRSIAGFIDTKSGSHLTFAMILNCDSCNIGQWQEAENSVMRELISRF